MRAAGCFLAVFLLLDAALILLSYLSDVTTWKTNEREIRLRGEKSILVEKNRPEKYTTCEERFEYIPILSKKKGTFPNRKIRT